MAYIAQRELKVVPLGTNKAIIYKPGDVIPDFGKWDEVAKRAHLNLNYVKEDYSTPEAKVEIKATPVAKKTKAKAKVVENTDKVTSAEKIEIPAEPIIPQKDFSKTPYACAVCGLGVAFESTKGLYEHVTLKHRQG